MHDNIKSTCEKHATRCHCRFTKSKGPNSFGTVIFSVTENRFTNDFQKRNIKILQYLYSTEKYFVSNFFIRRLLRLIKNVKDAFGTLTFISFLASFTCLEELGH
jgi:hypothetical protein